MSQVDGSVLAAKELDAAGAATGIAGSSTFQERLSSNAAAGSSGGGRAKQGGRLPQQESNVRTAFSERSANVDTSGHGRGAVTLQELRPTVPSEPANAEYRILAAGRQHESAKAAGVSGSDARDEAIPSWRPTKPGKARAPATSRFVLGQPGRDQHSSRGGHFTAGLAAVDQNAARQPPHPPPDAAMSAMQQGGEGRQPVPMPVQGTISAMPQQTPSSADQDPAR